MFSIPLPPSSWFRNPCYVDNETSRVATDVSCINFLLAFASRLSPPAGLEAGVHRRHGTVSPPKEVSCDLEEKQLAALTSSPGHSEVDLPEEKNSSVVDLPEEKNSSVVVFHNKRDNLVTLQEAVAGKGEVVLRHKAVSTLQEEELGEGLPHSKPLSLVLQRTASGPSTRKVSAEIQRTSSGSSIRKTSRPSTGTSPHRKSRFSVSSILSRRSLDFDAEKESLIIDQEEAMASPGERLP